MIASKLIKSLLTGVAAVAFIGTAIAQGTPPNAAKSAPVGAGQQSSQGTPMGVTGTQSGSSATGSTAAGSTSGTGNMGGMNMGGASSSGTTGSGSSMGSGSTGSGSSMGSSSTSADTSMTPGSSRRSGRTARADRN